MDLLTLLAVALNLSAAAALGGAAWFWRRASRVALPWSGKDELRAAVGPVRLLAARIEERGRLHARAGVCIAVAAALQTVALVAHVLLRQA